MERLTYRAELGVSIDKNKDCHTYSICWNCGIPPRKCMYISNALEKLADYEDLEEQGLLLMLPCKVGSPLYRVYKKPTKCTAYGEYKDDYACQGCEKECDSSYVWAIYKYKADIKTIVCLSDELGKTVFLTQAEAEQKLKEMESD